MKKVMFGELPADIRWRLCDDEASLLWIRDMFEFVGRKNDCARLSEVVEKRLKFLGKKSMDGDDYVICRNFVDGDYMEKTIRKTYDELKKKEYGYEEGVTYDGKEEIVLSGDDGYSVVFECRKNGWIRN
jgi:hypothetical protein